MNDMNKEVFAIGEQINEQVDPLYDQIKRKFSEKKEFLDLRQIILTGCGDSYFAGEATQYFFSKVSEIPTFVFPSMDAGRYRAVDMSDEVAKHTMQVAVSVSGNPPRTIEANQIASEKGVHTVAITANTESKLASVSNLILNSSISPIESINKHVPGIRTYIQSLLAEYLIAIHIANLLGKIDEIEEDYWLKQLKMTADYSQKTAEISDEQAKKIAQELSAYDNFIFNASGPDRATADFSAAKINESCGRISLGQDIEEWSHLQYFECAAPKTPTFLVTSGYRGHNRFSELLEYMKTVGRITIAISPEGDKVINPLVDFVLPVCGEINEYFAPIVNHIPATMFAGYLAEELGIQYFRTDRVEYQVEDSGPSRAGNALTLSDLKK